MGARLNTENHEVKLVLSIQTHKKGSLYLMHILQYV